MLHKDLTDLNLHAAGIISASDPGAIGAGKIWYDSSSGPGDWLTMVRNTANTAWEQVDVKAHTHFESHITDLQAYLTEAAANALYSVLAHTHLEADITDLQAYLTEADADLLYSLLAHTHTESDITDLDHDAVSLQGDDIFASIAPTDGQALVWDDANSRWDADDQEGGGGDGIAYFHAEGTYSIVSGASDYIDWTSELKKDNGFTHSEGTAPEEITLDSAGWYKISLDVGVGTSPNEIVGTMDFNLEYHDGGSWDDESQDLKVPFAIYAAQREDFAGSATWMLQSTGANWKLRVLAMKNGGTSASTITGSLAGTRITIERIEP